MWWDPHLGQQLGDVYMLIASHGEFVDSTISNNLKLGDSTGVILGTFSGKNVVSDFVPDVKPAFEYFTMIKFANIWPHGDEALSVPMHGGGHVIGGYLHDYFPQWITISYAVEYYKDNTLLGVPDVFPAFVLETASKMLNVQPVDTSKDVPFGYKFGHTDPAPIPDTIADGSVIKVYYIIDESQTYTINYAVKDGIGGSVSPTSETKQVLDAPTGSTASADKGYRFVNWVNAADDEVGTALKFVPTAKVAATFYAVFEVDPTQTYTINYAVKDGIGGSVSPTSETHQILYTGANDGSTATADFGYKFVNWVDAENNEVSDDAFFVPDVNGDATFYANFEISTVKVTFRPGDAVMGYLVDKNGDVIKTGTSKESTEIYVLIGTQPIRKDVPQPSAVFGYKFIGWYCEQDGVTYKPSSYINPTDVNLPVVEEELTFIAQWAPINEKQTFPDKIPSETHFDQWWDEYGILCVSSSTTADGNYEVYFADWFFDVFGSCTISFGSNANKIDYAITFTRDAAGDIHAEVTTGNVQTAGTSLADPAKQWPVNREGSKSSLKKSTGFGELYGFVFPNLFGSGAKLAWLS
jgi:uncharacterized repeat protein (TIGR02543 family)